MIRVFAITHDELTIFNISASSPVVFKIIESPTIKSFSKSVPRCTVKDASEKTRLLVTSSGSPISNMEKDVYVKVLSSITVMSYVPFHWALFTPVILTLSFCLKLWGTEVLMVACLLVTVSLSSEITPSILILWVLPNNTFASAECKFAVSVPNVKFDDASKIPLQVCSNKTLSLKGSVSCARTKPLTWLPSVFVWKTVVVPENVDVVLLIKSRDTVFWESAPTLPFLKFSNFNSP